MKMEKCIEVGLILFTITASGLALADCDNTMSSQLLEDCIVHEGAGSIFPPEDYTHMDLYNSWLDDDKAIKELEKQLKRLSKVNFHPNLLPIILKNRDYIELTPKQVAAFSAWREKNAKSMVAIMNTIARKRIEFEEAALSPLVSAQLLRDKQEEIFQLHRKLLDYKLSCRANIVQKFTDRNWEEFLIVLGDEGFAIPDNGDAAEFASFSTVTDTSQ